MSATTTTAPLRAVRAPVSADPRIGTVLAGRYRLLERLAAGAMGVVYRGERIGLARPVAIKFVHGAAAAPAELRRRFAIEAQAASRLDHPNCVPVLDVGKDGDEPYLVMAFVAGQSLRQLLEVGPLSVPRALSVARQLAAGLAHAHARGVIHRDVKPDNLLVWSDALGEHVQLTDFGLARVDALAVTQDVAVGTPTYMAPEQTVGDPVDARTDVYAAGVVLFELLAERPPFRGASPFSTMGLHRDAPVPSFDVVAPDRAIPPAVEGVVRRALAKRPADRYASAVELAAALDRAAAAAWAEADAAEVSAFLAAVRGGWGRRLGWLAGGLALVGLAVAAWSGTG
ncbi:MAG: serine/threonine protein kinase [Kofleriaceae bacterium]|jgi:serine/threonine protein kinase|nr:serine/threonine protein kinase [Kofleriaceae bacterium]MBP9171363.1 serine/threonine protein kinase [Kofleriaceae bacterium]MBP9862822.1 serine/threonine protein kinase [Kofleriaceae bacterium]